MGAYSWQIAKFNKNLVCTEQETGIDEYWITDGTVYLGVDKPGSAVEIEIVDGPAFITLPMWITMV